MEEGNDDCPPSHSQEPTEDTGDRSDYHELKGIE